ncbi:MAG: hypothetical protein ACI9UK_002458, partial [Candidatus Krumholzibacteriia bacterium]
AHQLATHFKNGHAISFSFLELHECLAFLVVTELASVH